MTTVLADAYSYADPIAAANLGNVSAVQPYFASFNGDGSGNTYNTSAWGYGQTGAKGMITGKVGGPPLPEPISLIGPNTAIGAFHCKLANTTAIKWGSESTTIADYYRIPDTDIVVYKLGAAITLTTPFYFPPQVLSNYVLNSDPLPAFFINQFNQVSLGQLSAVGGGYLQLQVGARTNYSAYFIPIIMLDSSGPFFHIIGGKCVLRTSIFSLTVQNDYSYFSGKIQDAITNHLGSSDTLTYIDLSGYTIMPDVTYPIGPTSMFATFDAAWAQAVTDQATGTVTFLFQGVGPFTTSADVDFSLLAASAVVMKADVGFATTGVITAGAATLTGDWEIGNQGTSPSTSVQTLTIQGLRLLTNTSSNTFNVFTDDFYGPTVANITNVEIVTTAALASGSRVVTAATWGSSTINFTSVVSVSTVTQTAPSSLVYCGVNLADGGSNTPGAAFNFNFCSFDTSGYMHVVLAALSGISVAYTFNYNYFCGANSTRAAIVLFGTGTYTATGTNNFCSDTSNAIIGSIATGNTFNSAVWTVPGSNYSLLKTAPGCFIEGIAPVARDMVGVPRRTYSAGALQAL